MTDAQQGKSTGPLKPLFWYSALAFAQRASWLLLLPLYLNFMGAEEVAVLFLINLMANFSRTIATLKLDAAMHTFFFDYPDQSGQRAYLSQVFSASLMLAAIFYILTLLGGPYLLDVVFAHDEVAFYPDGAIAIATACIGLCLSPYLSYLKNKLMLRDFAFYQMGMLAGTVGLQVLFVAVMDLGVTGALMGALIPALLALTVTIVRHTGIVTIRLDGPVLQRSLAYSLPLVAFAFLYMLEARLDRFVVERYFDLGVVGMYVTLVALLGLLVVLQDALDNAIRPFLFVTLGEEQGGARSATRTYARLYVVACLVGLSAIVFAGANLSWITDNEDFLSMRSVLPLGATAMIPAIYTRYCGLFFVYHKKSTALTSWMALRTFLTLVLLLWLVPRFGIEGAFGAILVSHTLNAAMFRLHLQKLSRAPVPIAGPIGHAMLFVAVLWTCRQLFFTMGYELFGVMQLVIVSLALLAMNRNLLRELKQVWLSPSAELRRRDSR